MAKIYNKGINMKRTYEEIVERANAIKDNDFFGFETQDLLERLPYRYLRPFLKEDIKNWKEVDTPIVETIINYLPFAWEKANNCRGISANRSISHFKTWLWLDKSHIDLKFIRYQCYGKPQLVLISEEFGFDWRQHDDGEWCNDAGDYFSPTERDEIINTVLKVKELFSNEKK